MPGNPVQLPSAAVEHAARLFSAFNEQAARSTMSDNPAQLPSAAVGHAARLFPLLNEQAARSTMPGNAIQLPSAALDYHSSGTMSTGFHEF